MGKVEHGTPEGYERGCVTETDCPAFHVHGLSCETAYYRFASGERRYLQLRGQGLTPTQIAAKLGFRYHSQLQKALDSADPVRAAAMQRAADAHRITPTPEPEPSPPTTPTREETPMPTPDDTTPDTPQEPTPAPRKPRTGHKPKPALSATLSKQERADCRTWAAAHGHTVTPRGRIAEHVIRAWQNRDQNTPTIDPAPAVSAETVDPDLDMAHRSDMLDETRARIAEPDPTPPAKDPDAAAGDSEEPEPDTSRPEWAVVALQQDLERARRWAIHYEQELAVTKAALEFTIRKWGDERERAADASRAATTAKAQQLQSAIALARRNADLRAEQSHTRAAEAATRQLRDLIDTAAAARPRTCRQILRAAS